MIFFKNHSRGSYPTVLFANSSQAKPDKAQFVSQDMFLKHKKASKLFASIL